MKRTFMQLHWVAVVVISCSQFATAQEEVTPIPAPAVQPAIEAAAIDANMPLAMGVRRPDVFYNFYLPPGMDGTSASMYPAPMPVPAHVGHSHYTYQPLLPHENMYRHSRIYYTPHGTRDMFYTDPCKNGRCGGATYTKTSVIWGYGSNHLAPMPFTLPSFGRGVKRALGATCR